MSLDPLRIVDTMHVTFSENLNNNSSALLSFPDRSADHYFMDYIDQTRKVDAYCSRSSRGRPPARRRCTYSPTAYR